MLLAALLLIASQQPAAPAPQPFKSGTQIVEVDVRVIKDGHFVTGLEPADFEVTEDGVAQKVEAAVLIAGAPAAATPSPGPAAATTASLAHPQVWLFVFDTAHLTAGSVQRTRDAVEKFIASRFRQGDLGGVVLEGRMINNRLTSDREELRQAALSVKLPGDLRSRQLELREWPRLQDEFEAFAIAREDRDAIARAVARACIDDPDQCRMAAPDAQVRAKAQQMVREYRTATLQTLTTIDTLAKGLARIPGSKTVVFLSEGFVLQDQEAQLRQAVGQAARAGAHFYSIDTRGLNKGSNAGLIDARLADNPMGAPATFDAESDGPNSLAVDTGGFAIRNENNFGRALDEIQADAATYYVVSYTPTNAAFDGKYRAISVKVSRPGVSVRARRGYLARAPAALLRPHAATPDGASTSNATPVPATPPAAAPDAGDVSTKLPDSSVAAKPGPESITPPRPATEPGTPGASAIRVRADAGKMVLALGKDEKAGEADAAQRGWDAYQKGDVDTAAKELGEAAKASDARPWVAYALGLSQFALRQSPEAWDAWERVRRAAPEFEPIYFSLADAYSLRHDEGTAIKVL